MTDKFGNPGEAGDNSFGDDGAGDNPGHNDGTDITPEDLKDLRKRDVNAQEHIPQLENENAQLRQQLAEAETQLEGSATLKDVLDRIENKSEGTPISVSADEVATQVEARLQSKAKEKQQDSNWNKVLGELQVKHGSFENVDKYVQSQASTLGMTTDEATLLAKNSPDAFMKLFQGDGTPSPQQGTASAAGQETSTYDTDRPSTRDKAFYDEMLKTNPKKYWKIETQMQLRKDVYGT